VASAFEEEIDAPMGNLNFTSLHNGLYCWMLNKFWF
jgi:hypothetical protein